MTLPSGTIYMSQVNDELGFSSVAPRSLNHRQVHMLRRGAGSYDMNTLRGGTCERVAFVVETASGSSGPYYGRLTAGGYWYARSVPISTLEFIPGGSRQGQLMQFLNSSYPGGPAFPGNWFHSMALRLQSNKENLLLRQDGTDIAYFSNAVYEQFGTSAFWRWRWGLGPGNITWDLSPYVGQTVEMLLFY